MRQSRAIRHGLLLPLGCLLPGTSILGDTVAEIHPGSSEQALKANCLVVADEDPRDGHYSRHVAIACPTPDGLLDVVHFFRTAQQPPLKVIVSTGTERAKLLELFRSKGMTARITDSAGRTTRCYCVHASYGSPDGYFVTGATNYREAAVRFAAEGASDVAVVPFRLLSRVRVESLMHIVIEKRDGSLQRGRWKGPDIEGLERRIFVTGICEDGALLSINAREVKLIDFGTDK